MNGISAFQPLPLPVQTETSLRPSKPTADTELKSKCLLSTTCQHTVTSCTVSAYSPIARSSSHSDWQHGPRRRLAFPAWRVLTQLQTTWQTRGLSTPQHTPMTSARFNLGNLCNLCHRQNQTRIRVYSRDLLFKPNPALTHPETTSETPCPLCRTAVRFLMCSTQSPYTLPPPTTTFPFKAYAVTFLHYKTSTLQRRLFTLIDTTSDWRSHTLV